MPRAGIPYTYLHAGNVEAAFDGSSMLVASAKSFMLSCMPLARMCWDHTLACLPRHFRTAHMCRARAASSEPVTIGEGLWGSILNLGGSPLSV